MGDLMITVEAMQDIKSKVIGGGKKISPFDELILVGAVASNKEEEIIFENSSSALEALRKLDALKIFCPRMDNDYGHSDDPRVECMKPKMGTLESKKVRDFEFKKPENTFNKKMKYSQPLASTQHHQDLPEKFKRKIETMGGCSDEERLVIQKELYDTDLAHTANRLSMPRNQCLCTFLEKDEEEWLETGGRELHITLIDPMVEEEDICLTQWSYNRSKSYVLRTQWNHVAAKNGLKPKDVIQVWSFRNMTNNKLHLALVKMGDSDAAGSSSSSSSGSTIIDA